MFLRKLAKAIRNQDWFTVFIEFLIVVMGIFVGLQADEWNRSRMDDRRASVALEELRVDFVAIAGVTERLAGFYEGTIRSLETLNRCLDAGEVRPEDEPAVKDALAMGDTWGDPPPPSGTYRDMVSSGSLALIRDKELRLRLIEYDESLKNIADSDAGINNLLAQFALAFNRHARLDGTYHLPDSSDLSFVDVELPQVVEVAMDQMLADPEFRVAAQQHLRLQIGRLINTRVTQSKIQQVQRLIDQALGGPAK